MEVKLCYLIYNRISRNHLMNKYVLVLEEFYEIIKKIMLYAKMKFIALK